MVLRHRVAQNLEYVATWNSVMLQTSVSRQSYILLFHCLWSRLLSGSPRRNGRSVVEETTFVQATAREQGKIVIISGVQ